MWQLRKWLAVAILVAMAGTASGQAGSDVPGSEKVHPDGRPDIPSVAEAERITESRLVVTYPRLVPIIQYGIASVATDDVEASFDQLRDQLGLPPGTALDGGHQLVSFALRVDVSYRWRIAAEGVIGGIGSDVVEDCLQVGVVVTYAVTPESNRTACLALGAGLGTSRLRFVAHYWDPLGDSVYLEDIKYRTAWTTMVPVLATLEVPNLRHSRGALVFTAAYRFAAADEGTLETYHFDHASVPVTAETGGWNLSLGLAMGF